MSDSTQVDYLIVGQGIAGSVLSFSLLKENKKVVVIDEPSLSQSSRIAAGIVNPVVFKRLTKSWKADETLAFAADFYKRAEATFNKKIYSATPIIRIFKDESEKNLWLDKAEAEVGRYLSKTAGIIEQIDGKFGSGEVKESAHLNVPLFLSLVEGLLKNEKSIIAQPFEFDQLNVFDSSVNYKGVNAKKIIFCEGYYAIRNPYFNWLPFKPAKGELLTVRIEDFNAEKIINRDIFILPLGDNLYKVGATYEWNEIDEKPTQKGKTWLGDKLSNLLKIPYEIVGHKAGVRPAVSDRKPLLGLHPEHAAIAMFNGMGTKGIMLAPYFAKQMIDFLENNAPIDKEADILRFWKK